MRLAATALGLALLFAAAPALLDERLATWTGILPVGSVTATASSNPDEAGLAVDTAPETTWEGVSRAGQSWTAEFGRPVQLERVMIDMGMEWKKLTKVFDFDFTRPFKPVGPRGEASHEQLFLLWHRYEVGGAIETEKLVLRHRPSGFTRNRAEGWTLRDVRFGVADPIPFDTGVWRRLLLRSLLPFALALAWVLFVLRPGGRQASR